MDIPIIPPLVLDSSAINDDIILGNRVLRARHADAKCPCKVPMLPYVHILKLIPERTDSLLRRWTSQTNIPRLSIGLLHGNHAYLHTS